MISRRTPQSSIADSFPVRPNCFNGNPRKFKEWCFSVELALRSRNIEKGPREVELVSSLLEGNALLWLIACQESSTVFNSWTDLRSALARTFGPLQSEEEDRLDLLSLRQETSLNEYITDFTRLSLSVTGLDEHSRAILFVKGLTPAVQAEALREHPRTLSDAFTAARVATRQLTISVPAQKQPTSEDVWKPSGSRSPFSKGSPSSVRKSPLRTKLDDNLRGKLMREGKCFKCRDFGHLSKNCPERNNPNADRPWI